VASKTPCATYTREESARTSRLLAQEPPVAGDLVARVLRAEGLDVVTGRPRLASAAMERESRLHLAYGRAVLVDDNLRVSDWVWAVGDATGKGAFTQAAIYQAAGANRSMIPPRRSRAARLRHCARPRSRA
jgi:pyruvate/2-oxoglutarate dehydrogenase complex dihydrolipoamide dehydrogenase (E3) component